MKRSTAITVMLSDECLEGLDDMATAIRRGTGKLFTRSKLVRAIIAGVINGGMDFSKCRSEDEAAGLLAYVVTIFRDRVVEGPKVLQTRPAPLTPPPFPSRPSKPASTPTRLVSPDPKRGASPVKRY